MPRFSGQSSQSNPLSVLGLNAKRTTTVEEVRKRYLELAKMYHPDVNTQKLSASECATKFTEIKEAYSRIMDNPNHHLNGQITVQNNQGANGGDFDRVHDPNIWGYSSSSSSSSSDCSSSSTRRSYRDVNHSKDFSELLRKMEESIKVRSTEEAHWRFRREENAYAERVDRKVHDRMRSLGIDPKSVRNAASSETDLRNFMIHMIQATFFIIGFSTIALKNSLFGASSSKSNNDDDYDEQMTMDFIQRYIKQEKNK